MTRLGASTDAAATYRAALPAGRLVEFPITALDRVGVPAWSVTLYGDDGRVHGGHGYGADDDEARTGALGELSEVTHARAGLAALRRREGSFRELSRVLGRRAVADPRELCLPAGSPVGQDTLHRWVPARRLGDGVEVWVPLDLAASLVEDLDPGYVPFTTPITNGLGAGLSRDQAVAHAVLEILQRDGNGLSFRALDQGVVIDGAAEAGGDLPELLGRLEGAGVDLLVKLASTEFGLANVYVVGADRDGAGSGDPLMATACGEACSPDRGRAVRKALAEFAAARGRKAFTHGPLGPVEGVAPSGYLDDYRRGAGAAEGEERRALDAMVAWLGLSGAQMRALLADNVLSERARVPLAELPTMAAGELADPALVLERVTGRLAEAGLGDVLVLDLAPPDVAERGVHVVKVLIPGTEVETMSYHRIGERGVAKLLARGSRLVGRGQPPPGARPVRLTSEAVERLGGPAWLDVGAVDSLVGALYPLYREPGRHVAPLHRMAASHPVVTAR